MCAETSSIASGFGNYTREILSRLYHTGKYEIAELSSYRTSKTPKTEPWKIYPVAVDSSDQKLFAQYTSSHSNQYGHWRFELALLDFKPDIVFDIRDFWYFGFEEISPLRPFYYWLIAPTYDSTPQRLETLSSFKNADLVGFHTKWAQDNLKTYNNNNNINIGHVVSDSVDPKIFKPLGFSKKFNKAKYNLPSDSFIIGSVMRNQKRKLIHDIFKILKNLINKNPDKNIFLYLHTSYPETTGWEIPALLLEHGVEHNVVFTYKCKGCNHHYANVFSDTVATCPKCKQRKSNLANTLNGVDPDELNMIYNTFDVYLQYAICEGFGIPQVEAASAGIPIITVNHGAMAEVGNNLKADIVDIDYVFRELETSADRVYPDNSDCESIIQKYLDMDNIDIDQKGKDTRELLLDHYSWDKTAKVFEDIFDNIDLSNLLPWNSPHRDIDHAYPIANIPNNRDFIYSIIDNNIKDPWLKHTNFIEEMIKCLDHGFTLSSTQLIPFDKNNAVKILEAYMNNKKNYETLRLNDKVNFPEDLKYFLQY